MPELPEVEVTRRGVAPHVEGRVVTGVTFRHAGLRWPFPTALPGLLSGQTVLRTSRRGKYLLLHFEEGVLIIHLGMSGSLRILPVSAPVKLHDHFDLALGARVMRLNDPRRFGAVLWHDASEGSVENHLLLRGLGVEPLEPGFSGDLLYRATRARTAPIKQVLLAGDVVVGVGNIYASESLYEAAINPRLPARRVGRERCERLATAIKRILAASIEKGGSTLRDFVGADGRAGYFQQSYFVYDRAGLPCTGCGEPVRQIVQGQRSTFYCPRCQK